MLTDEYRYKILKRLETHPEISQRELAQELDVSLGRVNFCLKALIKKGLLKANNFRNSSNKRAYLYLLTPKGLEEKARVTVRFLRYKVAEYETLKGEIEQLRKESRRVELKPDIGVGPGGSGLNHHGGNIVNTASMNIDDSAKVASKVKEPMK